MDISSPSLVPRAVPDLRPSADVAASARLSTPAAALPPAAGVPPASPVQGALVARGLLDPRAVSPTGAADRSAEAVPRDADRPPPRVLKPWGVPMLPAEERKAKEDAERRGERPEAWTPAAGTGGPGLPDLPLLPRGLALPASLPWEEARPEPSVAAAGPRGAVPAARSDEPSGEEPVGRAEPGEETSRALPDGS